MKAEGQVSLSTKQEGSEIYCDDIGAYRDTADKSFMYGILLDTARKFTILQKYFKGKVNFLLPGAGGIQGYYEADITNQNLKVNGSPVITSRRFAHIH